MITTKAKPGSRKLEVGKSCWLVFGLLATSYFLLSPSAFSATHVTGTYDLGTDPSVMTTVNGTPEYGLVFVQRNKAVTYNGVNYGTQILNGYLDAGGNLNDGAGNLWLDLIPSTIASPSDSYYVVTLNIQGQVHSEIWVVPDVGTVDATAVRQTQPATSSTASVYYQFVQQSGADLPQRRKLNLTGTGVSCADNAGGLSTDCTISGGTGGGAAPIASATTSGTVKTDSTVADPVVYLKTSADSLLAGKADTAHTHSESDVTNLVSDLAAKVPATRQISTSAPLVGGGTLAGDLTLSLPAANVATNGYLASSDWNTFNSKENALTFSAPLSRSVNTISCPTCEVTGNKNAASGYAGLDASSKLAASQGREVWSVTDLTDYASTSGTGSAALRATVTSPATNDVLTWNGTNWINQAPTGGGGGYSQIQEEGANVTPQRTTLNFVGSAVTAADDAANSRTNVTFAPSFADISGTASASQLPDPAGDVTGTYAATSVTALSFGTTSTPLDTVAPTSNQFLRYNGSSWRGAAVVGNGSCTNQFVRALNNGSAPTCESVASADIASGAVSSTQLATANKTLTKSIVIFSPTTSDTNLAQFYWPAGVTLQRIACSTDTGTVDINLDERSESAPNTAGTNALASALSCTTTTGTASSFSDSVEAGDVPVNLQIAATSGTPGVVRIHVKAQVN